MSYSLQYREAHNCSHRQLVDGNALDWVGIDIAFLLKLTSVTLGKPPLVPWFSESGLLVLRRRKRRGWVLKKQQTVALRSSKTQPLIFPSLGLWEYSRKRGLAEDLSETYSTWESHTFAPNRSVVFCMCSECVQGHITWMLWLATRPIGKQNAPISLIVYFGCAMLRLWTFRPSGWLHKTGRG